MVLNAVEAVPVGSELPAADNSMRTFMGGRYGFDALAPLLTRALPMHFSGARGSAIIPKLVKLGRPVNDPGNRGIPVFHSIASIGVWFYV